MNNNILISILVVIVVVVGLVFLSNNSKKKVTLNDVNEVEKTPEKQSVSLLDGTYSFSMNESQIQWEGKKTLVKDWVDIGFVSLVSGDISIVDKTPSSGKITIDMNSISATKTGANSGEDKLSMHLKSADFFDTTVYPTGEFKVSSISLIENNNYKVTGDIKIKGITKIIEFPASIYMKDNKILVDGEITLNRADFNVRYGSKSFFNDLGDKVIDDNFILRLKLVAIK